MPRKRRKRKRDQTAALSGRQYFDLLLTANPSCGAWDSKLQQRAAWFRHREEILGDDWMSKYPGQRPGGWWRFETEAEKPLPWDNEDEWEVLFRLGEIDETELNLVAGQWIARLYEQRALLRILHDLFKRDTGPHHSERTWPNYVAVLERQAGLCGKQAVEAWHKVRTAIIDEWEEDGCGGCPDYTKGCQVTGCKFFERFKNHKGW